jgi:acyl-coenzyme A thioesterase 9
MFGGYLMREAFELAYANAMLYARERPLFISLDEIAFKKPIPIGSILHLTSNVVYTNSLSNFNDKVVPVAVHLNSPKKSLRESCFQVTVTIAC